ncbi:MAG TPA: Ig domain-containing protein, partial [Nitrospirota bacterium]|nr:Ig domain-containing protein [Nitrospirota bacterium]
ILTMVNTPPRITSAPPVDVQDGAYRYQVTAQDDDGDRLAYSLITAPQGMTINPSTGLIAWEPKPVAAREEVFVKIVVSDGDGGSMTQEYSLILEP